EHNFLRRQFHIAPLKSDPLPNSWAGLPAIEFIRRSEAPDSWFLPAVHGLLKLPLRHRLAADSEPAPRLVNANAAPARISAAAYVLSPGSSIESPQIELLVNTSPSERSGGTSGSMRRNMSAVIPALKVLSGIDAGVHSP